MFMSSLRELKAGPSAEQLSAAQLKRQQLIAGLGMAKTFSHTLVEQARTQNKLWKVRRSSQLI